MRKSSVLTLALIFSIVTMLAASALPISMTAQADPETTVYLDPPTINGTAFGVNNTVTVNIKISDAIDIYSWQAGLIFNPDLLECMNFTEGPFLKSAGPTFWLPGTINNTLGMIDASGSTFQGDYKASGDGTLAYLTFTVKDEEVSDLHLRDVMVIDYYSPPTKPRMVPFNILDVYTVIVDSTGYTVVTVSNSTGLSTVWDPVIGNWVTVHSGFYNYAFNLTLKEISFKVTGPYPGFSKVAVPKTLLNASTLDKWRVIIDRKPLRTQEMTVTENATHHLIYFTYREVNSYGGVPLVHEVILTTRSLIPSNVSITSNKDSILLGENVTISGAIEPPRTNVTVYIENRTSGTVDGWTVVRTVLTDQNSNYSYTWTPGKAGTYEVRALWDGDMDTEPGESELLTIEVRETAKGIDPLIIAAAVVVVIIVVAIMIYFVKFRKPKEE